MMNLVRGPASYPECNVDIILCLMIFLLAHNHYKVPTLIYCITLMG